MIELLLPLPPSVNHYYGRSKSGQVYIKKPGLLYRELVVGKLRDFRSAEQMMLKPVMQTLVVYFPVSKVQRDDSNLLKCLDDALQAGKVFKNDSQIRKRLIDVKDDTEGGGYLLVRVEEIQKETK